MTAAMYLPGDALAIVTQRVALLTAADGFDGIDELWRLVAAGDADVPTILDALAGDGLAAMPGFALAVSFDDAVSLVLRDGYLALVDGSDGARTLDATGVATWVEHRIEPGARVRIAVAGSTPDDDARSLPIEAGIVRASAVTLRVAAPVDRRAERFAASEARPGRGVRRTAARGPGCTERRTAGRQRTRPRVTGRSRR